MDKWRYVLLGCVLFMAGCNQSSTYEGPQSDHFNGKKFFNPGPAYQAHSFWDVLKWRLTGKRAIWPANVAIVQQPTPTPITEDKKVKVTFINHATVLIQTKELTYLTDPIFSERASPFSWIGPKRVHLPGIAFKDLPKIDVVLISHNHYDHLDLPTLKVLAKKFQPVFLVALGNKKLLIENGINNVIELDWWDTYKIKNATLQLLPSRHWSARWLNDKFAVLWTSYGIDTGMQKIYFAGDTGYGPHFKQVLTRWGKPDLAILPIGAYEPRSIMQENHLNPTEAVQAYQDLQATFALGIHFGTFQLTDEAITAPVDTLHAVLLEKGLTQEQFFTLTPGLSKEIKK